MPRNDDARDGSFVWRKRGKEANNKIVDRLSREASKSHPEVPLSCTSRTPALVEASTQETTWPGGIAAITLFIEDLESAKAFYQDVFQLPVFFEDSNSAVFRFDGTLVNLLRMSEAPGFVAPAAVAPRTPAFAFSSPSASKTWTRCASGCANAESSC